ncbi:hypothetical protein ACV34H_34280, partial [Pseudomonas aeruginosa]
YKFLDHGLCEIDKATGKGWGNSHIFVSRLLQDRADLAKVVMAMQSDTQSPLDNFSGVALSGIITHKNRHKLIAELLSSDA